jgi:hypothetical protein
VSRDANHIDLFVVGFDGGIYHNFWVAGTGWDAWHSIPEPHGGATVPQRSVVTAVSRDANHIDLFVVGFDGGIYHNFWAADSGWDTWHSIPEPHGGATVPQQSVVTALAHRQRIDLFVVGYDGGIYSTWWC